MDEVKDMNDRTHCATCKHYCENDERQPCYAGRVCIYTPVDGVVEAEPVTEPDPTPPVMKKVAPPAAPKRCTFKFANKGRCRSKSLPGTSRCKRHKGK